MKNKYEAMIILPKALAEDALDSALAKVKAEIEKVGGAVSSTTRLGKRSFARLLKKQDSGHYAVVGFELDGAEIAPLLARFKLDGELLRVQIVRAGEAPVVPAAESAEEKA